MAARSARSPKRGHRSLALAAVLLVAVATSLVAESGTSRLGRVQSWHYQLKRLDVEATARSSADLIVMDHSRNGRQSGMYRRDEIETLRKHPDGSARRVLAYLSVGEAEEYRYYWDPTWKQRPPDWLIGENCRWPDNYLVRFWAEAWKEIVYRGARSYLALNLEAGFDGVYLDRVDAYWDLRKTRPQGRAEMIDLVIDLAATARRLRPGSIIVAQNAEDLLDDRRYRAAIDGVAKEDLLYGIDGTGIRNAASEIKWSTGQLRKLAAEGKPVMVVEYLTKPETVAKAAKELARLGFVATFAHRALDGRDPLALPASAGAHPGIGTPEFASERCSKRPTP